MSKPIADLMERQVVAIDIDDTVADIQAMFARKGLTWAPVLDAGSTVVGVISASDLLQFHGEWQDPEKVRAWQLCTYKPIMVADHTPAEDVARLMVERRVHHVVVTDAQGIAGVVSSLDFVRLYAQQG
jgi:CBS domain-containing protein